MQRSPLALRNLAKLDQSTLAANPDLSPFQQKELKARIERLLKEADDLEKVKPVQPSPESPMPGQASFEEAPTGLGSPVGAARPEDQAGLLSLGEPSALRPTAGGGVPEAGGEPTGQRIETLEERSTPSEAGNAK